MTWKAMPALAAALVVLASPAGAQATATNVTPPPAPTVTSWSPQSKVVAGMPITITGSSFNPATIEVRLGGQKLFLISKSPSAIVARAPLGPGTRSAIEVDFRAGTPLTVQHGTSQARTLDAQYRVLDRFRDFDPRLLSMTIDTVVIGASRANVILSMVIHSQLTLAGLPGNAYDSVRTGPVAGSTCGQRFSPAAGPPSKTYSASPDGGTLGLKVLLGFDPVHLGPCQLFLPLALHYQDAPGDVRIVTVNLGTHAIQDPRNTRP